MIANLLLAMRLAFWIAEKQKFLFGKIFNWQLVEFWNLQMWQTLRVNLALSQCNLWSFYLECYFDVKDLLSQMSS